MVLNVARDRGFSLVEILSVILIIFVLSAFGIAALAGIQGQAERSQARVFLGEIQSGLDLYHQEFGSYPLNESSSADPLIRNAEGLTGSAVIYRHLSGDFDEDGKTDASEQVYLALLTPSQNTDGKTRRVAENTFPDVKGRYLIVDNFNAPVRYLGNKSNHSGYKTRNPGYDVWTITNTDPGRANEAAIRAKYITNW